MSEDDIKRRQMGSEKAFMCGVCEGRLIILACFAKHCVCILHACQLATVHELDC